jgi:uncharacterized protein (TIGR02996 family)
VADSCDALLAHLAIHPDDADAQRIYADALSEHGDPRGELIALELAFAASVPAIASDVAARVAVLRELVNTTLAGRFPERPRVRLRWHRGFVRAVDLDFAGDEPFDVLPKLAAEPALRLLRRITISALAVDGHGDFAPVIAELARVAPAFPSLVELEVTEGFNLGNPWIDGPVDLHDVTAVLHAYPRLERLVLDGELARFGAADMATLRVLHLEYLDREGAATLAGVRAPVLDDLAVGFRSQPVDDVLAAVDAVLATGFAPTALTLVAQAGAMAAVIARAAAAPFAARVRRLGFGYAQLDDPAIAALLAARPRWPQLVEFRIAERACTADARARIARAFGVPIVVP